MSIDAMKQALEALEEIHPGNMTPMAESNWDKAITALRAAIEQAQESRQWQGLTDDEADELVGRFARYELLRTIEAKLKEKNHA